MWARTCIVLQRFRKNYPSCGITPNNPTKRVGGGAFIVCLTSTKDQKATKSRFSFCMDQGLRWRISEYINPIVKNGVFITDNTVDTFFQI